MSWHCSQEQEEDFSLPDYLGGLRSVQSSGQSTPETSYCNDSGTGCSSSSLFGTMSARLTGDHGGRQLMLFPEGFPAKTSARRVLVAELPESVRGCGDSICESLRKFGLALSSRKTVRSCEPVDSAPSSKTLTAWGMTCDGECWELGMSVQTTGGTECGLWPTPTSTDHRHNAQVKGQNPNRPKMGTTLCGAVKDTAGRGSLNPTWVEWLMGWPSEWTALKPLEMAKYQQWLQLHSEFCQKDGRDYEENSKHVRDRYQ